MITSFCAAYDGWQDRGSPDGRAGGEHKPDKGDMGVSFKGDGYHDWLSPWDGHTPKPSHPDYYRTPSYTYPVYYYYYSVPYYNYYPYYNWYYTPLSYDQWWDPWWGNNVYGTGGAKYSFSSSWSHHSGFGFGDP